MTFFLFHFLPLSAKIFLPRFIDLAFSYMEEEKQHLYVITGISEWPDSPHLLLPIPSVTMRPSTPLGSLRSVPTPRISSTGTLGLGEEIKYN